MDQMTAEGIVVAGATRWIETDSLKRLVRPVADIPHRIADRGRDSGRRLVVPHVQVFAVRVTNATALPVVGRVHKVLAGVCNLILVAPPTEQNVAVIRM